MADEPDSNNRRAFSLGARLRSFGPAVSGCWQLLVREHNARLHLFATMVAVGLATWLQVERWEWCAVIAAIGLIWVAEAINTAIEALGDAVTLEQRPLIGRAKDVAAAGVLLASITSMAVGLVVFLPHLYQLWRPAS